MENQIDLAHRAIQDSKLVGIPTETVYGLAAPIHREELVKKIFSVKERPFFDPLIVHVSTLEMAKSLVTDWPTEADLLVKEFWPGPLTIVLPKNNEEVSDLITSGLPTVGIRMPNHQLALDLINKLGKPVAAPSANKFTKVSPTEASHVKEAFSSEDVFVIDGGACQVGIESTIITFSENKIILLRPGMISPEELEKVSGLEVIQNSTKIVSPGNMKVHYRPEFTLILGESLEGTRFDKNIIEEVKLDGEASLVARNIYQILRRKLPSGKDSLFLKIKKGR